MDGGMSARPIAAASFDTDAQAIFAAFTTPPDGARKTLINDYVLALKVASVWDSLLGLYVFAAADSPAALINWKSPGTFNATLTNSPTFTQDRGFTGNGTSAYIDTNFTPSTDGGAVYTQNSAHWSARNVNDLSDSTNNRLIGKLTDATGRVVLILRDGTGNVTDIVNGNGALQTAGTDTSDHFVVNRSGVNDVQHYKAGASIGSSNANGSTALSPHHIVFLADPRVSIFSACQIASGSFGGSLDGTKAAALAAADLAYMQEVGAV